MGVIFVYRPTPGLGCTGRQFSHTSRSSLSKPGKVLAILHRHFEEYPGVSARLPNLAGISNQTEPDADRKISRKTGENSRLIPNQLPNHPEIC